MFEDAVKHSADTVGWLDDVWNVLFLLVGLGGCVKRNHVFVQCKFFAVDRQLQGFVGLEIGFCFSKVFLGGICKVSQDYLAFLLELFTNKLLVRRSHNQCLSVCLFQRSCSN